MCRKKARSINDKFVADVSRTEKTICLAVSPSLKSWGISGRPRLFEVVAKVKEINSKRRDKAYNRTFEGSTYNNNEILDNNNLELSYIAATPRMALYIKYILDMLRQKIYMSILSMKYSWTLLVI